jgi:hypothetical protein
VRDLPEAWRAAMQADLGIARDRRRYSLHQRLARASTSQSLLPR